MTVKDLREILSDFPDNATIILGVDKDMSKDEGITTWHNVQTWVEPPESTNGNRLELRLADVVDTTTYELDED